MPKDTIDIKRIIFILLDQFLAILTKKSQVTRLITSQRLMSLFSTSSLVGLAPGKSRTGIPKIFAASCWRISMMGFLFFLDHAHRKWCQKSSFLSLFFLKSYNRKWMLHFLCYRFNKNVTKLSNTFGLLFRINCFYLEVADWTVW